MSIKIKNPFKMNDWDIKSFLIVVISILLLYLGVVGLDRLDIQIPLLRQIIGFVNLTFIPGYLLLRILRIHNLSSEESFLYAVGLSLFLDMFVGFLMNMFYPLLGITDKPITEMPIILTMSLVMLILSIVAYIRDKDYENPDYIPVEDIINPQVLFLSLIPFMAIFGTYLVNYYNNNILLMLMIVVIALISLIVGFTNWIDEKYYPYAIWVIAISLLYHITLITPYAINHDGEMIGARIIIEEKGYWDPHFYGNYNSIIVTKIFTPMIYFICNISLTWIYKIVFPIFTSMIPIIVYLISNKYSDYKKSFFSTLIFMISGGIAYVTVFTVITKQAIATLFTSLMINVIVDKKFLYNTKLILSTIFGVGIIFSHYGTTYLILFGVIFTIVILYIVLKLIKKDKNNKEFKNFFTISLLYVLLAISWYIYVSGGSVVKSIFNIGTNVFSSIWDEFLSPQSSRGAYILFKEYNSILHLILKYINLSAIFFIILGILNSIQRYKLTRDIIYIILSLYFLWILILSVILPHFAVMSPGRLYILGLIMLSLFCVKGSINLLQIIYRILNIKKNNIENDVRKFLSIYLFILILLNTGFIGEITQGVSNSIALSKNSINMFGTSENKAKFYSKYIMEHDIYSIKWLSSYAKRYRRVYYTGGYTSIASVPINYGSTSLKYCHINKDLKSLPRGSYVLLLYVNIKENIGFSVLPGVHWFDWYEFNRSNIYPFIVNCTHKIYTNGGSQVLLVP